MRANAIGSEIAKVIPETRALANSLSTIHPVWVAPATLR